MKLPLLSGSELVKVLKKAGFYVVSQRGSHIKIRKDKITTIVPNHKEVDCYTLAEIIRQCGLTREKFMKLL